MWPSVFFCVATKIFNRNFIRKIFLLIRAVCKREAVRFMSLTIGMRMERFASGMAMKVLHHHG